MCPLTRSSATPPFQQHRFDILGYIEEGTTTTPWSMLRLNKTSRFDIAAIAVSRIAVNKPSHKISPRAHELEAFWHHELREHEKYTLKEGADPEWTTEIPEVKEGNYVVVDT